MLYWAAVFFGVALVAAFLGFGGIAGTAAAVAKILFYTALALFVVTLVIAYLGRRSPHD